MKLLESLQHTLVRYLSCKIGRPMSFIDHNYTPLMTLFKLPTISQLFHYHDYLLAYKLFYNIISLPGCTNIRVSVIYQCFHLLRDTPWIIKNHKKKKISDEIGL